MTQQKSKLKWSKPLINPGKERPKGVARRKKLMREFDPQNRCSRKEDVGREHPLV